MNLDWEGKTRDGRGAGSSGGRGKEILERDGGASRTDGATGVEKHLSKAEWEEQEGQLGQGAQEAPAAQSNRS